MATWESKRVVEVIQKIDNGDYVLPVIQRRLVWGEDKMELLFDSLLKRNSFGGIMTLTQESDESPIFAFRKFSRDGEEHDSVAHERLDHSISLIIDGQQRLQAFYMGLKGTINGKSLYFNLLSPAFDYEFKFAAESSELTQIETDDEGNRVQKLWYPATALFNNLKKSYDNNHEAEKIIKSRNISDEDAKYLIRHNVNQFFHCVFNVPAMGISSVIVNKNHEEEEKQRVVELFRRLNDGGTRLSSFDLVASVFKGFNYKMELFFKDIQQFKHLGIAQDEVIKLIFLLQDTPSKEVIQIKQKDANFAIDNKGRIINALKGMEQFLKNADLSDYYDSSNRSVIPLYFIACHIFHKHNVADANLVSVYDNYDTNNPDFICLKRWAYLSVLNGVFSRGCGWIPYRTGIRKILRVLEKYKGQQFPVDALFDVYRNHPLRFTTSISPENLDNWDSGFVFYLIYNRKSITGRDVDHIQPQSLLAAARSEETGDPKFEAGQIHSMANYQLLDIGTNRGAKQGKELKVWLQNHVTVLDSYLKQHLIPPDPRLWTVDSFDEFSQERAKLITERIQANIPDAIDPPPSPNPEKDEVDLDGSDNEPDEAPIDKAALRSELPPAYRDHSILRNHKTWHNFYKQSGCGPVWASRYSKELSSKNIETLADFALLIMFCKLEFNHKATHGDVYHFCRPLPNGQNVTLKTNPFGGWGWKSALEELEKQGFNWQDFVVDEE